MNKHPLLRYLFIASLISIFLQLFSLTINIIKDPKEELLKNAEKIDFNSIYLRQYFIKNLCLSLGYFKNDL
jgi:hypothetical protein